VFTITPADVQTDVGNFLRATQFEFGKYIKSHTFTPSNRRSIPKAPAAGRAGGASLRRTARLSSGDRRRHALPAPGADALARSECRHDERVRSVPDQGVALLAAENNKLQEIAEGARLGVPLTISTDPRNHFQYVLGASVQSGGFSKWPEALGLAAIGDPRLVRRFADIARQEYRAVGIEETLSPQADLATEPRWSRINGTFGEDADLTSKLVRAYVEGFQHGAAGVDSVGVLAVVKHWVGYGAQKNGYDSHSSYGRWATFPDDNLQTHIKPFLGAFAAHVAGVMPTYSILEGATVNGRRLEQVGAGFNRQLLSDLLRRRYGFDGIILTDWAVTNDCSEICRNGFPAGQRPTFAGVAMPWGVEDLSKVDRFSKAVNAGVDQFGGTEEAQFLVDAVRAGKITASRIDESVRRIAALKFRQGLFENPYVDTAAVTRTVGKPEFQAEATAAQRRSLVLLENKKNILPLVARGKRVYLHHIDPQVAARYGFTVVPDVSSADIAIVRTDAPFQTLHPSYMFGSMQHEGRLDFQTGDKELEEINRIAAAVPTIVTVYLDRPAILTSLKERTSALLANFGVSDAALLDVLTGVANPEGRLPFELPSSMEEVEAQRSDMPHDTAHPLYPIGFGLHYAGANLPVAASDWRVSGGDPGTSRYSSLDQITRDNVGGLRVAWTYHTGDAQLDSHSEIQSTPIVIGGVLYSTTPALAVVALNADNGTLLWRFDPFANRERQSHVNRGVVYWSEGNERRIFFSAGRRLYSLDAITGRQLPGFGDSGWVDLGAGLGRDIADASVVSTSPGIVYQDLLIQGTRVGEGEGSAPGDIRAYDARTGTIRWTFHTIPRPGEFGYDTWPRNAWQTAGGANSWPGMSVDTKRGVVYIPTGSATPDFYGGNRVGANLFANTLLALDAKTGKRLWHFQTVHHDIWDRDLPAAPNLLTITRNGKRIDAVAQIAKSGFVFVFDRGSGSPLFPIEERAIPTSDLEGERAWATQPFPSKPAPFARQSMTQQDLRTLTPGAQAAASRLRTLRNQGLFTPPSLAGSVVLPGFDGGGEWGGAAVDRDTGVMYVNASDVPWIAAMRKAAIIAPSTGAPRTGPAVYATFCASCHGTDRRGKDRAPSLVGVGARLSPEQLHQVIERGRGFMPSFANLPEQEKQAVMAYLRGQREPTAAAARNGSSRMTLVTSARSKPALSPYEFVGYERWRDSAGSPVIKPPWGTLSAIDLNTGDYLWRIPLGNTAGSGARTAGDTGTEQYGGPIVTAGGLVFIAATTDARFRAFDKRTGKLLWETALPAAGFATPSTYSVRGKQYVVIAAGGGKLGTKSGDAYVAFSLPD
jgi:glucose dehydrogenase/beta-glucosidase-like glycosyl hydrolase